MVDKDFIEEKNEMRDCLYESNKGTTRIKVKNIFIVKTSWNKPIFMF